MLRAGLVTIIAISLVSCTGLYNESQQKRGSLYTSSRQCNEKPTWQVTASTEQLIHKGDNSKTYRICEIKNAAVIPLLRPWVRLADGGEVPIPNVPDPENCVDVTSKEIIVFAKPVSEEAVPRPLIGCYIELDKKQC